MLFKTQLAAFLLAFSSLQVAIAGEPQWDSRLTRGTLDNGLSYILYDSGRAEDPFNVRLVVHAGSVDEDRPSGVAHILEHMAFQSTRAHPETLHRYFQALGWRTGVQVNAVTRETETQYMVRTRQQDSLDLDGSLALVADLAFGAALKPADWEKERSVILEELRQGDSAADRISRQKKAILRVGSRYEDRSTIGTRESIEKVGIEDIRAFHDRFYVASNMTLIVSGRIDPDDAKASIARYFAAAPSRPRPDRSYVRLPLKDGLTVGRVQDRQGSSSQVTYAFRLAMPDRKSEAGQFAYLEKYLLTRLIRDAVQSQAPRDDSVLQGLGFVAQETTDQRLILAFNARSEHHDAAMPALLETVERIRRNGLSLESFNRVVADARRINNGNVKAAAGRSYAEWEDKITSAVLMDSVLDDPAARAERTGQLLDRVTFEGLNARMREMLASRDQVLFYQFPGGVQQSVPSSGAVEAVRARLAALHELPALPATPAFPVQADKAPLPPWPAYATLPTPGRIVSESRRHHPEISEWLLSNGDKVVWLVRNTQDGKIYLSGQAAPGFMNAEFGSLVSQGGLQLWTQSGFGFWTQEEYDHWSKAQPANWSWVLKEGALDVAAAMKPEDLPLLLKRYAASVVFGQVREEAAETFRSGISKNAGKRADPYARLLRGQPAGLPSVVSASATTAAELEAAARAILHQPVTWFAVGPAPTAASRDAFASFVAAVPRSKSLTAAPELQQQGIRSESVNTATEDRARVQMSFFTLMDWTPEASFLLSTLTPLTQQALKNRLRLELGGIYTLQFELKLDADTNRAIGTLSFYCAPARAPGLAAAALDVLKGMPAVARSSDFERLRADIAFAEASRLNDPSTWLRRLELSYRRYGDAGYLGRMSKLGDQLTPALLEAHARQVFRMDNLATLTTLPAEGLTVSP